MALCGAVGSHKVWTRATEHDFSEAHSDLDEQSDSGVSTASDMSRRRQSKLNVVCFSDCAEVVEIESFKEFTRFTPADRANADIEWRSELFRQLHDTDIAVQRATLARLQDVAVELALADDLGSSTIQQALTVAPRLERVRLMRELQGSVLRLLSSEHGCKVILTCLHLLPQAARFIAKEIEGYAVRCTQVAGGIELMCSLLRHLENAHCSSLVKELLSELDALCLNEQASAVVECLLESGTVADQEQMRSVLVERMDVMHGEALFVLEQVLVAA